MFKTTKRILFNIESLNSEIASLNKNLQNLTERNEMLERIIQHSKKDIDFESDISNPAAVFFPDRSYTYVYKDGIEYKIDDLYLYNPTFKLKNDHVIEILDNRELEYESEGTEHVEYIVDLEKNKFVQTGWRINDGRD